MQPHERDALDQCIRNIEMRHTCQSSQLLSDGGFVNVFRVGDEIRWSIIQGRRYLKGIRQEDGSDVIEPAGKPKIEAVPERRLPWAELQECIHERSIEDKWI